MSNPTQITLDLKYDADGILDESTLLIQLESQLGGRIKITDWVGERAIAQEYPHLNEDERRALISSVDIGDYDDAINSDVRRIVLDKAAQNAGLPRYEGDEGETNEGETNEVDGGLGWILKL